MKKSTLYKVMMAVCGAVIAIPALYADEQEAQVIPKTAEEAAAALVGTANTVWTWAPTEVNGGAVWGNCGYMAGPQTDPTTINGAWWGCGPLDGSCGDKFDGQLQHSSVGSITGEEYMNSYMEFGEDGSLKKYSNEGILLNTGDYKLAAWYNGDYIGSYDGYKLGELDTSAGAILWPYQINGSGYEPKTFEIGYLSDTNLILLYAPEGSGAWSECTWWSFKSADKETVSAKSLTSDKGVKVSVSAGVLYITADKAQTIAIFDTNGKLVKNVNVKEGKNAVKGLNKGMYIVNSTKVKL